MSEVLPKGLRKGKMLRKREREHKVWVMQSQNGAK